MEKEKDFVAFEGDAARDMVTYRLIDLSVAATETAFEQDGALAEKYAAWLDDVAEHSEKKPIILYDMTFDADAGLQIFALPAADEFYVVFKTPRFEASVSLFYNASKMDADAARVVMFSGSPSFALSWVEAARATLDDLLMNSMNGQEDDE